MKQPIAYASVSLTESQRNYAQIEKELFAILFGCTKFHQYIYGSEGTFETDHKRFMLRLQCYNLVVYKPGKDLKIADTLSRATLEESALSEVDEELFLHCNFIASNMEVPFANIGIVRERG